MLSTRSLLWVVVGQRFDDASLAEIEGSGVGRLVEKGGIDAFLVLDCGCDGRGWARPEAVGPVAHIQSRGCCCATPGPLRFFLTLSLAPSIGKFFN